MSLRVLEAMYENLKGRRKNMENKMIYGRIEESKSNDINVYVYRSAEEAVQSAKDDWDRLTSSEKKRTSIVAVGHKIKEYDYDVLVRDMGFEEEDIKMSDLSEDQACCLLLSGYDEEYWNSSEWEERDVYFKTEGGDWKKAFLDVEDALFEYESNWDEEEDGGFSDDTEVSLEVGKDKYGREWFSVAGPNQFTTTTVGCVKTWWKWYPDEMIREVKLS